VATEIASAYISLIPTMRGVQGQIQQQVTGAVDGPANEGGRRFGDKFGGAFSAMMGAGALLGGMALVTDVLQQSITEADLPGTLRSQFALSEADAAAAAKAAGEVYTQGFGESLTAVGDTAGSVKSALNSLGDTGDLTELTTQAQGLADKFKQDVGPTITAASQLVKTGLASNMDEAFDLMTVGFQSGANAGDDLVDTITEYSTKFRDLGLNGSQAMGLINQGLEAGARNSDLVADSLKEFSIRAIDGSKTTAEGFRAIGLDAETMASKIAGGGKGAAAALDQTLDALRGIEDPVARDAAAVALFGTTAEDLGDSLYALDPSDAADKLGKVGGAAEKLTDSKGAAQSITALGRSFKDELGNALEPLVPLLSKVFEFLKPLLPILAPLAAILGVVALGVGLVTAATWLWNTALLANPVVLIIAAIIAAAALVIYYWDGIVAALQVAWEWIADLAETVWGSIVDFFTMVGTAIWDAITTAWNAVVEFFVGIWDAIVAGVTAAWDFIVMLIVGYFTMMFLIIETVLTAIVDFFTMVWDGIVAGVTAAWTFIVTHITGFLNMIYMVVSTVITTVVGFLSGAWEWIKSAASAVWSAIVGAISAAWEWIKSAVKSGVDKVISIISFLSSLPGKAAAWFGKMRQAAIEKLAALITWARGVPGKVLNALGNVAKKLWNAGKNLIRGLLDGMKSAWGAIKNWILGKLSDFKDTVLDFFGISSPSKLMMWVGEMVWGGVPIGAKRKERAVQASTDHMTDLATPDFGAIASARSDENQEPWMLLPVDFGEGVSKVFEIKRQRQDRHYRRAALAGSGANT
jgi:phage-related protein